MNGFWEEEKKEEVTKEKWKEGKRKEKRYKGRKKKERMKEKAGLKDKTVPSWKVLRNLSNY